MTKNTQIPDNPFILVDGSSYLFRAFYALPPLTNSKGKPTGAIYGVINMLKKLLTTYHASHIAVVFDTKEPNFRHKLYEKYKANRTEMPDDLAEQIQPLHKIIRSMGIPLIAIPGIEADDIIGTLAVEAEKSGKFVLVSTGDKDMAQLVNDKIVLINTMTNTVFDKQEVENKFGVPPKLIVDFLTLVGDTVDNIPGIEKVGPKTAVKWLKEYGSLANIINNADKIKGKVGENLRSSLDKIDLYKELTTIQTNLKIDIHPKDLIKAEENKEKLHDIFLELEFKTWLKELEAGNNNLKTNNALESSQERYKKYNLITNEHDFEKFLAKIKSAEIFSFDTETDNLNAIEANLVGISFSINTESFYIPLQHKYDGLNKQLDLNYVLKSLKPILENPKQIKVAHNIKYDMEVLSNYEIEVQSPIFDSMIESYVINSTLGKHDLDSLAKIELNINTITYEEVAGKGAKQIPFASINIEKACEYAAEDADVTLKLHTVLYERIDDISGLKYIYENIELPLVFVLKDMEQAGVLIDVENLNQQSKELEIKLQDLEKAAYSIAGTEFNVNSPKQLQEILFNKLQLPAIHKTPTGQPSTAENVLQELSLEYELPKIILQYRSLSKLKSTYTDKLPKVISEKTGRIHTSYNQTITSTGRLSSTNPNLQNIPIKSPEGKKIRTAFVAPKGYKILSADYSQIELRIMAHLSNDQSLIDTFHKGEDVHQATAAEVWGIPLSMVTKEQRRSAKAINFGLIYGMSAFGLSKQLGVSREEAQEYINSYFTKFPGVRDYMENAKHTAKRQGFVETMFGRRLYLPNINSKNAILRKAAERAAINAPMQGAQADIIKLAMIAINKWIKEQEQNSIKMLMQVHDELVFEVKDNFIEIAKDAIPELMTEIANLKVDLLVDVGIGSNWEEAH